MKWYQMQWAQKYWGKESRQRYQTYLQSDVWKAKRKEVLKVAGYRCRRCGARATEVHHETYKRIYNENLSDLTALCENCHKAAHTPTPRSRKQKGKKPNSADFIKNAKGKMLQKNGVFDKIQ